MEARQVLAVVHLDSTPYLSHVKHVSFFFLYPSRSHTCLICLIIAGGVYIVYPHHDPQEITYIVSQV
jgi:hypothetical protein